MTVQIGDFASFLACCLTVSSCDFAILSLMFDSAV